MTKARFSVGKVWKAAAALTSAGNVKETDGEGRFCIDNNETTTSTLCPDTSKKAMCEQNQTDEASRFMMNKQIRLNKTMQ